MGEIVNLNRVRKRRARARAALDAKENRVRFGRTAVETAEDRRAEVSRATLLDDSFREPEPPPGPSPTDRA